MTRYLSLPSTVLLAAALHAQCPQSFAANLVPWDTFDGYASFYTADDEGIVSVALPFSFPMPGHAGTLNQMWISSNGEVYLADAAAGLLEPIDAADFGVSSLLELQGAVGGLPRIVALGDDQESSAVAGAEWSVSYETGVPGQVTVTWIDMARYANATDRYSFQMTLFASGAVQFDYGTGIAGDTIYVGVSVGNAEPSTSGSQDLTTMPSSTLTEGILYEAFTAATWDLAGQSVLIVPDLTPGNENYLVASVLPYTPPTVCASHEVLGIGCHGAPDTVYQVFADAAQASAAMTGNGILFVPTSNGYSGTWLPGVASTLFLPPTGAATSLPIDDDGVDTVTLPAAFPNPFGAGVTQLSVSHNGVVSLGATTEYDGEYEPAGAIAVSLPSASFFSWSDYRDTSGVSPGTIKTESFGSVFCITWDGVDHWTTPQVASPSTLQFQFDTASGNVTLVWVAIDANTTSTFGSAHLIGVTNPGVGTDPGSLPLASLGSFVSGPDIQAMSLRAAPRPVINPSTTVTYTADDLPEFAPASGLTVGTLFLSVNPLPGGFDLTGILTTVAGCNAYIATLDVDMGAAVGVVGVPSTWNLMFDNVIFAPGNVIGAQAVGLFIGGPLPNGEASGFQLSNGVQSITQVQ